MIEESAVSFPVVIGCVLIVVIALGIVCLRIWQHHRLMRLLGRVTSPDRGEASERETVLQLLKLGIDHRAIFHDCYVRRRSGIYTQIDLVVATRCGLIVFEIKDYSGYIYGKSWQRYWTQVLSYGREKYHFYNPIMQNSGHISALRENLPHNPGIPIYSVIVFYGKNKLKKVRVDSDDVFIIRPKKLKKTMRKILSRENAYFGDKHEIMDVLRESVDNGLIPEIVSAQREAAAEAAKWRPYSSPSFLHRLLNFLRRLLRWLRGQR